MSARIKKAIASNNSGSYEIRETSRAPLSNGRSARLGEPCLSLEESRSMNTKHPESSGGVEHTKIHSRSDDSPFFAGFTFSGDQELEALAGFYGLSVPVLKPRISVAEYLARTCYGSPRPGYRVELGSAELIVRQLEEGAITQVGLRLLPGTPRRRRHYSVGTRYGIGASLVRTGRGATLIAALPR
jgi:hypothetical protein